MTDYTYIKPEKKLIERIVAWFIIMTLACTFLSPFMVKADSERTKKTVRVSCDINNSLYLDDKGNAKGYCAEYLGSMAEINNWNIEYVSGTWGDCYEKFLDGDVDILFPTQKSAEREKVMNFSSLNGGYQTVAMFSNHDSGYCYNDFSSFDGKKIAVSDNSSNYDVLKAFADDNNFTFVPVFIEDAQDKVNAVKNGDADFAVFSTLNDTDDLNIVAALDILPYYYAVSKDNKQLLEEVDYGMEKIMLEQPDLVKAINNDTLGFNQNTAFTKDETEYINSSPKVVVGFYKDTAPMADYHSKDDMQGIYIETLKKVSEETGIDIEFYPIDRSQYGFDLVKDGTIDFIIGSSDTALSAMNTNEFIATDPIMEYNTAAITRQNYQFDETTSTCFALTSARRYWEDYIYSNYPNATIDYYEDAKDCLNAVERKKADVTLLNTLEYNYQSKNPRFSSLIEWESVRIKSNTIMVCLSSVNPNLLSVINKGINRISDSTMQDIIYYYLNIPYHSYSFADHLYSFRITLIIVGAVILVGVVFFLIYIKIRKKNILVLEAKNHELVVANTAKTDFLSRMSHDIRTPLNGIIGMTEIATADNKDTTVAKSLEHIASSSRFLLSLINDILDISKIENGSMKLHEEAVPLEDFDKMIDSVIRPLMAEKDIEFEYSMCCGMNCAYIDSVRFGQIFFNLLSNAAKFTQNGGKVAFKAEQLSDNGDYEWVRFTVSDNGAGMKPEFIPHAFTPFEQDSETNAKLQNQGTGLGLSITKELCELMGGKITLESEEGEGTVFTVDLPLKKANLPDKLSAEKEMQSCDTVLCNKKILLAEDNNVNAIIAKRLLEVKKITVYHVCNGEEAVNTIKNSKAGDFDAVLMDIRMPVMDGITATKAIRELDREDIKNLPIIAMTANAYTNDVEDCLNAGMNGHIAKPVDPDNLYKTLAAQFEECI